MATEAFPMKNSLVACGKLFLLHKLSEELTERRAKMVDRAFNILDKDCSG